MSAFLIVMFVAVIAIAQPGERSAPQVPETLSPEEAGKIILKKRVP